MPGKKELIAQAIGVLHEKAHSSADLARAQRANADVQHANACKLEQLSVALEDDAMELQRELDRQLDHLQSPASGPSTTQMPPN